MRGGGHGGAGQQGKAEGEDAAHDGSFCVQLSRALPVRDKIYRWIWGGHGFVGRGTMVRPCARSRVSCQRAGGAMRARRRVRCQALRLS